MRTNPEHFAVFISLLEIPDQACCVVVLQHMKCIEPNYRIKSSSQVITATGNGTVMMQIPENLRNTPFPWKVLHGV